MDGPQVMHSSYADFTVDTDQYFSPRSTDPDMAYSMHVNQVYNDFLMASYFNNCFPYATSLSPSLLQNAPSPPYFNPCSNHDPGCHAAPSADDSFDLHTSPDSDFSFSLDSTFISDNDFIFTDAHEPQPDTLTLPRAAESVTSSSTWNVLEPKQDQPCWALPCSSLNSSYHTEHNGQEVLRSSMTTQRSSSHDQDIEEGQSKSPMNEQASVSNTKTSPKSKEHDDDVIPLTPHLAKLCFMDSFRFPCSYSGCNKTFKRKEHAKRHYTTTHEYDGQELVCEFCGKNTFNRTDNLNAHRKLHAQRRATMNNGVHFVAAAAKAIVKIKPRRGRPRKYVTRAARLSSDSESVNGCSTE